MSLSTLDGWAEVLAYKKKKESTMLTLAVLYQGADRIHVEFPEFPGCFSCGDTYEEAIKNARDAIQGHVRNEDLNAPGIQVRVSALILRVVLEALVQKTIVDGYQAVGVFQVPYSVE